MTSIMMASSIYLWWQRRHEYNVMMAGVCTNAAGYHVHGL
jgi:hypothetical protein